MMQEKKKEIQPPIKPLKRNYSERQYQRFENEFKKRYPDVCKAIKETGGCTSPVVFAMYESGLFYHILGNQS